MGCVVDLITICIAGTVEVLLGDVGCVCVDDCFKSGF